MIKVTLAEILVATLIAAGCSGSPPASPPPPSKTGVEVHVPGADVSVGEGGVDVKTPGAEVHTEKK